MNSFLCAIGGGNIGKLRKEINTYHIDKQILKLTNKIKPKILFIPTASNDSESYCEVFKNYFEKEHNSNVEFLFLIKEKARLEDIRLKIFSADIIYIGGGDTELLIKTFEKYNLIKIIREAIERGINIVGFSAGGIILFERGISEKEGNLRIIEGFGFIKGIFCPHSNKKNINNIKKILNEEDLIILSDDSTALLINLEGKIIKLKELPNKKLEIMKKINQKFIKLDINKIKLI